MGIQVNAECWCDNILHNHNIRDPNEGQCGMNQRGTKEYNSYGCI